MEDWRKFIGSAELRQAEDLRAVLRDKHCTCTGPVYSMYRNLAETQDDRQWLASVRIRFDITCIPAGDLCGEYVKTKGHYHPMNPAGEGYPEIYQVFEGKAHYLLQNRDLSEVILVEAYEGETVAVPPNFGHVTINPGPSELVMANLVSDAFESDYRFYEDHRGAAYYELLGGSLERNPHYPPMPPVVRLRAPAFLPGFPLAGSLYGLVEQRDTRLRCLNHPEQFRGFFTRQA